VRGRSGISAALNQALQQTGHANDGVSCFSASSRVSRLLRMAFAEGRCVVTESIDFEQLCELAWEYGQEDRMLPLQAEHWYTGLCPDGKQLLVALNGADANNLWFDSDGRLLGSELVYHGLTGLDTWSPTNDPDGRVVAFLRQTFGFNEGIIYIRCFEDRKSGFTVKLLPHWLETFMMYPERTPEEWSKEFADSLQEWITRRDTYVLEGWGNTFFIDSRDGHCTAS
jgi:hypothetical protein